MRHSFHSSFCCYVYYPWFQKKKSFYNFLLRSLRHGYVKKKQNFISALRSRRHDHEKYQVYIRFHKKYINYYYANYAAIMTKIYIFPFHHYYIHYTVMMRKSTFSPVVNCYYVHYAVIMTKIYLFISALRVLNDDHDKKYTFFHFSTTLSRS